MAKLDDSNTIGFYVGSLLLAAGSGFEVNKSYVIYITATVGGVTGTAAHSFQVEYATWSNPSRTLTMSPAQIAEVVVGEIACTRGDTFAHTFTGLTLTGWTKVYFGVKRDLSLADSTSEILIKETNPGAGTDGLLYLNKAAPVTPIAAADASLTVDDIAGTVVVAISAAATALLDEAGPLTYDLQVHTATAVTTVENGFFYVSFDVVQATS